MLAQVEFWATLMDSGVVPIAKLTEVFRQAKNSLLVENSHRLIKGLGLKQPQGKDLQDFYFIPSDSVDHTYSIIYRLLKDRIPDRFGQTMLKHTQVLTPMKKGPLGTEALNERLQEWINPDGVGLDTLAFKKGDKVIQLANNYEVELFNGDMGEVLDVKKDEVKVLFGDKEVVYPRDTLSDLALSYACTVHKSQGSEYPIVIMPIHAGHRLMLSFWS